MNGLWAEDEILKLAAKVAWLEEQLQVISLIYDVKLKPYKEPTE